MHALENELDGWIAEAIGQAIGTAKPHIMNTRERKNAAEGQRHAGRALGRAQKKAKSMQRWEKWADEIFLTYSWNERKDHCVLAFSETYSVTGRLTDGYKFGARAARVCEKTAWSWITAFEANEGFHDLPEWGKHSPVPFVLDDEDIKAKCIDWINAHEPRRGRAGFTALQFCVFLVGDTRLDPPTTGIFSDILEERGQKTITERTANTYLHRLGRRYDWLKPGTFSDKHEDFQDDRIHRYLPKEQAYFDQGPNFFRDSNGEWHSIESAARHGCREAPDWHLCHLVEHSRHYHMSTSVTPSFVLSFSRLSSSYNRVLEVEGALWSHRVGIVANASLFGSNSACTSLSRRRISYVLPQR